LRQDDASDEEFEGDILMLVPITALFAGLLAIFSLVLSARAGTFRGKAGVPVLYGNPVNEELAVRVRVHQNFLEYVPILLILMAVIEMNGGSNLFLYVAGVALILVRIAHATGLKFDTMSGAGRFIGAAGTALLTLVAGIYAAWLSIAALT